MKYVVELRSEMQTLRVEYEEMQSASLVRMLTELKCLSYQQIADELQGCENITLHADGTSKFGQHCLV